MGDRAKNKGRMAIYTLAGFYLIYMSTRIFKGLPQSGGGEKIVLILAMVLFVLIGAGLMIWAIKTGYELTKKDKEALELSKKTKEQDENQTVLGNEKNGTE